MKLRYLHLPSYGPLSDLRVVFDQSEFTKGAYSLNFIAGVNATGKSSLMRAVFEIFRALEGKDWPAFPFDLVYEIEPEGQVYTVAVTRAVDGKSNSGFFFAPCPTAVTSIPGCQALVDELRNGRMPRGGWNLHPIDSGDVARVLPSWVFAYTSGARDPWLDLQRRVMSGEEISLQQDPPSNYTERPVDWTSCRELESAYAEWRSAPMTAAEADEWQALLSAAPPTSSYRCLFAGPLDIKLAGLTLCLSETAADLTRLPTEPTRREFAAKLRKEASAEEDQKTARWVLKQAGVLWPTHLSFSINPNRRKLPGDTEAKLFALYGLAEAVIRLPLDREQVVVSLTRAPKQPLEHVLQEALGPDSKLPGPVQDVVNAVGTPTSNAEALIRLLGEREEKDTLFPAFRTLRLWTEYGLLEDVTATFRRIRNDDVVTCESLSDGEQMILGRMGLLFLLKNQQGSLLLLDEPETHFNDAWKRQIVDVLHDNLKATRAHVLISTHSSIALSDAFSREIVRLVPGADAPEVRPVAFPTFGAEPGRIMVNIFDAPDSIGSRALESLHEYLKNPPADRETLERLVAAIGGGWPRAKLREILDKLDAPPGN